MSNPFDWNNHYRSLENMYHGAGINQYFAPRLEIQKGEATVTVPIKPEFFHALGATHGSVYFKVADDAAFFAANSIVRDTFVLTSSFHLHLLRPIASGNMVGKGRIIQNASHLIIAESVLYDDRGREIGRGTGSFAKTNLELKPEVGYKL